MEHPNEIFHYTLMNKDTELIKFSLKNSDSELTELSDIRVLKNNPYSDEKELKKLVHNRKSPGNREYIDKMFELMRINTISEYLNI